MALVDAAIVPTDSCSVVFDTIQFATVTMYKPISVIDHRSGSKHHFGLCPLYTELYGYSNIATF